MASLHHAVLDVQFNIKSVIGKMDILPGIIHSKFELQIIEYEEGWAPKGSITAN